MESHTFTSTQKEGVYNAIYKRRDVRTGFKSDPIHEDVLRKILNAAHHAPSVGFMQPWNFIIIRDEETKKRVKESFEKENETSSYLVDEPRRTKYLSFKLEGIMEAPINICVTCDRNRFGPFVIGRTSILETDIYSVCCAIQNLWLAARAEGIGVGWVSILSNDDLRDILEIPSHILPVAYLCLGYVTHFSEKPDLEKAGWLKRLSLEEVVFIGKWGQREPQLSK
ncbi:MAG: 5,6-dimethylbenzimidazole synthase [Candidatus Dadabacteria bacterium]